MRWIKLLERYSLVKRPTLKVVNPRVGTSIIPLSKGDGDILFQYLTNKIHALHFEGSEVQLKSLIEELKERQGFTVQKMKTSISRGQEKMMLLHLRLSNDVELRRVIKLS